MSARADVLLWAQRVIGRKGATAHQILEIAPSAGPEIAQEAFHKLARMAHPDLHRRTLPPEELELVTTAYARAAAAYQEIRRQRPVAPRPNPEPAAPTTAGTPGPPTPARRGAPSQPGPLNQRSSEPNHQLAEKMSAKALIYFRKAELALRRGDLAGAVLQLKMAIASDPRSPFLRSALAEVEAELRKNR